MSWVMFLLLKPMLLILQCQTSHFRSAFSIHQTSARFRGSWSLVIFSIACIVMRHARCSAIDNLQVSRPVVPQSCYFTFRRRTQHLSPANLIAHAGANLHLEVGIECKPQSRAAFHDSFSNAGGKSLVIFLSANGTTLNKRLLLNADKCTVSLCLLGGISTDFPPVFVEKFLEKLKLAQKIEDFERGQDDGFALLAAPMKAICLGLL